MTDLEEHCTLNPTGWPAYRYQYKTINTHLGQTICVIQLICVIQIIYSHLMVWIFHATYDPELVWSI